MTKRLKKERTSAPCAFVSYLVPLSLIVSLSPPHHIPPTPTTSLSPPPYPRVIQPAPLCPGHNRGPPVGGLWRSGRRALDWEHEHSPRRQQDAVSRQQWAHQVHAVHPHAVWGSGPGCRLSRHSQPVGGGWGGEIDGEGRTGVGVEGGRGRKL